MLIKKIVLSFFILLFPHFSISQNIYKMACLNLENEARGKGKGVKIAIIETYSSEKDFFFNPIKENTQKHILCKNCDASHQLPLITNHGLAVSSVLLDPSCGICPEANVDIYFLPLFPDSIRSLFWELQSKQYDIISCSFKAESFRDIRNGISDYLKKKNTFFILSAGNDSIEKDLRFTERLIQEETENKFLFACSVNQNYEKSDFSNYGIIGYEDMFLYAPGEMYLPQYDKEGEQIKLARGTSLSAPFIAGIAALVKEKFPNARAEQIKEMLLESAFRPLDKPLWGSGVIRVPSVLGPETSLLNECFEESEGCIAPRIHGFDRNSSSVFEMHIIPKNKNKRRDYFIRAEECEGGDLLLRPHPFVNDVGSPFLGASIFGEDRREILLEDNTLECWSCDMLGYTGKKSVQYGPRNLILPASIFKNEPLGIHSIVRTPFRDARTFHWLLPKKEADFTRRVLRSSEHFEQFSEKLGQSYIANSSAFRTIMGFVRSGKIMRFLK